MFEPVELEALSRRQVVREAAEINSTARRYLKLRRQIEVIAAALTRFLETHATVAKTPLKVVTDYAMHIVALACAYGIDLVRAHVSRPRMGSVSVTGNIAKTRKTLTTTPRQTNEGLALR